MHMEGLEVARQRQAHSSRGLIEHNLGEALLTMGEPQRAIEHLLRSATSREELSERSELARCHLSLSEAYEQAGDPTKALEHFPHASHPA